CFPFSCCFLCFGARRDLHSFPTRRSSDLGYAEFENELKDLGIAKFISISLFENELNELKDLAIAKFVSISPVGTAHIIAHGLRPDRKSTRLNSSHVKISYAVFCLKKKKNK